MEVMGRVGGEESDAGQPRSATASAHTCGGVASQRARTQTGRCRLRPCRSDRCLGRLAGSPTRRAKHDRRWLDPVADKLLQATGLILVAACGFAPLWIVLLLLGKELALIVGCLALSQHKVVSARPLGKAASLLLFPALVAGLANLFALRFLLYTGAALSLLAGLDYLLVVIRASSNNTHTG